MVKITMEEFYTWRKEVINNLIEEVGDFAISMTLGKIICAINHKWTGLESSSAGSYVFVTNAEKREVTMICMDDKKFSRARCHKNDEFSAETAIAICYAKLKGWEVPRWAKFKSPQEIKPGEKFRLKDGEIYKFVCEVAEYEKYIIADKNDDLMVLSHATDMVFEMV